MDLYASVRRTHPLCDANCHKSQGQQHICKCLAGQNCQGLILISLCLKKITLNLTLVLTNIKFADKKNCIRQHSFLILYSCFIIKRTHSRTMVLVDGEQETEPELN